MNYPEHVLIVGFDGVRPDVLQKSQTPNTDWLIENGSYTFRAETTLPTWTLQSFVSHLAGVEADRYELISDPEGWLDPRKYPVPSIFDLAHEAGMGTAMFNNWKPLDDLPRPGSADKIFSYEPENDAAPVIAEAVKYLLEAAPQLCFVHLGLPDAAGHAHGWDSPQQREAVAQCDTHLGELIDALKKSGIFERTMIMLLSDHGGGMIVSNGHGDSEDWTYSHPLTRQVPWICCGPGIKKGHQLSCDVSICDTAATAAHMLGFAIPEVWQGRIVEEAVEASLLPDERVAAPDAAGAEQGQNE